MSILNAIPIAIAYNYINMFIDSCINIELGVEYVAYLYTIAYVL